MKASEIIKWKWISVILTKNPNTVRADRNNKKHEEKVGELLDFIQGWIDEQLVKSDVKILVKVPEAKIDVTKPLVKVREKSKTNEPDFRIVDSLPTDRKLVNSPGLKGLYYSEESQKYYSNKVIEGKLEIREWKNIELAQKYIYSLK